MAENKVYINLSLTPLTVKRLQEMSDDLNISKSACVDQLVTFASANSVKDIAPLLKTLLTGLTRSKKGKYKEFSPIE